MTAIEWLIVLCLVVLVLWVVAGVIDARTAHRCRPVSRPVRPAVPPLPPVRVHADLARARTVRAGRVNAPRS